MTQITPQELGEPVDLLLAAFDMNLNKFEINLNSLQPPLSSIRLSSTVRSQASLLYPLPSPPLS